MKFKCKHCKKEGTLINFESRAALFERYKVAHPDKPLCKDRRPANGNTALTHIYDAAKTIRGTLKDLEFERDELHRKIVEYDDQIAKYTKLL